MTATTGVLIAAAKTLDPVLSEFPGESLLLSPEI